MSVLVGVSDWFLSDQVSSDDHQMLAAEVGISDPMWEVGGYPGGGLPLPCDLSHNACVVPIPPHNRMRDTCENITFPQHLWREVINYDFSKGDVHVDNFECPDWSPF